MAEMAVSEAEIFELELDRIRQRCQSFLWKVVEL